jgi:hypothetical protein
MNASRMIETVRRLNRVWRFTKLFWIGLCAGATHFGFVPDASSQLTAYIPDAFWSYQQDCDGDGNKAGTLPGNFARLTWSPSVTNCSGTLNVFEIISQRACGTSAWTPIYTNPLHSITGCRSMGQQYVDVLMGSAGTCRDIRIQIFRQGQTNPDYTRSSTNDVDLAGHQEELLSEDSCLSDFFSTCVSLSGAFGYEADNSAYATKELGEPDHAGNPGGHSLWYCWTAPTNTPVTFDTIGSGYDTLLAVYTGNNVASLTLTTNNDDIAGWTNRFSKVTFTPVTGTTYHIAVDGFGGASGLSVLNWKQGTNALPDLILWGPAVSPRITVDSFGSTDCEQIEGCVLGIGSHRLLRFNAETRNIGSGDLVLGNPATNSLFVFAQCHAHYHFEHYMQYDLMTLNGDVAAAGRKIGFCVMETTRWLPTANPTQKYTCVNQGLQVGWADTYGDTIACQYIDITGVAAGDYVIRMTINPDNLIPESDYNNNTIQIPVTIPPASCTSTPTNDAFTNGLVVAANHLSVTEVNNCASKQSGEPNHAGNAGGHSLWFNFTPGSNYTAVVTTRRSTFDTLLAVYTGSNVSNLSLVASNDDIAAGFTQSQVSFAATTGTTYRIAVDGKSGAVGTAIVSIDPPVNDDFSNRFSISGTFGTTNAFNSNASKQPNEPAHAGDVGGHSIWFQWTAPLTGPVDFNTLGSTFDTTLAVYTNNVLTPSNAVTASNDDDAEGGGLLTSRVSFFAIAGRTYPIAVDGFGGDAGDVVLSWNMDSRLEISRLANGQVQLNLIGVDWQRYILQSSTNLKTWRTNVAAITMSGGAHAYTNSPAENFEFYRALRLP